MQDHGTALRCIALQEPRALAYGGAGTRTFLLQQLLLLLLLSTKLPLGRLGMALLYRRLV